MFRESEIDGKKLADIINDFYNNPEKLENMSICYEKIEKKNASELIVNYVLEDLGV